MIALSAKIGDTIIFRNEATIFTSSGLVNGCDGLWRIAINRADILQHTASPEAYRDILPDHWKKNEQGQLYDFLSYPDLATDLQDGLRSDTVEFADSRDCCSIVDRDAAQSVA